MFRPLNYKSSTASEELQKKDSVSLVELFERDIETFFEFVENLNLYDMTTVNDYSDEREKIQIRQWLEESKTMLHKGYSDRVSRSAMFLIDDICRWSVQLLSPTLQELSTRLDKINQHNKSRIETIDTLQEEYDELVETSDELIDENKKINAKLIETQEVLAEAQSIIVQLLNGRDIAEIEKEKELQRKVRVIREANKVYNSVSNDDDEEDVEIGNEIPETPPEPDKKTPTKNNKKTNILGL